MIFLIWYFTAKRFKTATERFDIWIEIQILLLACYSMKYHQNNFDLLASFNQIFWCKVRISLKRLAGNRDRSENLWNIGKFDLTFLSESTRQITHETAKWGSAHAGSRDNVKIEIAKNCGTKQSVEELISIRYPSYDFS